MINDMYQYMHKIEKDHWWFYSKRKIVLSIIKKYFGSSVNAVADFGCGTGIVLHDLQKNFDINILHGFDFSLSALDYCKSIFSGHLAQIDLSANVNFEVQYDCVIFLDVLEHINEDGIAVKNLFSSLKHNGIAIITVPAFPFLWSYHDEKCMHKRRYTFTVLYNLLKNVNFSINYLSYYNCFLFPIMLIVRIVCKLFHINTKSSVENKIPYAPINFILKFIFSIEEWFILHNITFPFGGSLICVLQKK